MTFHPEFIEKLREAMIKEHHFKSYSEGRFQELLVHLGSGYVRAMRSDSIRTIMSQHNCTMDDAYRIRGDGHLNRDKKARDREFGKTNKHLKNRDRVLKKQGITTLPSDGEIKKN